MSTCDCPKQDQYANCCMRKRAERDRDAYKRYAARLEPIIDAARKALSSLESPHESNVIAERHLREALREIDTPAQQNHVNGDVCTKSK